MRPDKNLNNARRYQEKASRSIVIDLGMHAEERGRILHRLMEIATFRQLGLRGYPYVRTATGSLTRLGVTLNEINIEKAVKPAQKLAIIQRLTLSTDMLNLFFTYGVTGRWESLERASGRIRQNLALLRENRIPGNQTLSGYLERYFWSANSVEVLRSRYLNLRSRIDSAANLVKTEFERKQAKTLEILTYIAAPATVVAAIAAIWALF